MNIRSLISGAAAAACSLAIALPPRAAAAVSDEDFNALKDQVTQQGQRIDQLEKTHQQDQQTHQQDQQQIQQLRQQLEQTQTLATNAVQKAEAATAQLPAPAGPPASHNFTMVGDAEVQFGKTAGQHAAFALADFAPIFLFRESHMGAQPYPVPRQRRRPVRGRLRRHPPEQRRRSGQPDRRQFHCRGPELRHPGLHLQ